ncbi:GDP-L-fucose synthase family protein [Sphingomonas hengshuiensis]|uniref:GDP-L-fucose synthase family protein n=1 Tax=Sphingomonas hengshuiensis TaxID=1609977 RepID=UPI000980C5A6|nr:GDP-L-fucose synthase [Sphingomonas hengshuiensis]
MSDLSIEHSRGRVLVAGHKGMVGAALVRRLERDGTEVVTLGRDDVDLTSQAATFAKVKQLKPDSVIVAAAKVGGIYANSSQPAPFIYDNLVIAANLIEGAHRADVNRLVFLGSSCIYPRDAPQPIREEHLLTGPLEPTNEWYAIAKIAGIKLAQAYRRSHGRNYVSVMPTNLYGPGDNYHPQNSHVPAALIRRFHEAKVRQDSRSTVWGTGRPMREFLHVDDLADGTIFVLDHHSDEMPLNIGTGHDITIAEFARAVAAVVGFTGDLEFDSSRPDGAPRKLLDVSRLAGLGWTARIPLKVGLADAYSDFVRNHADLTGAPA